MPKKYTLESFKDALYVDTQLKETISGESDIFDMDNGVAIVHQRNIMKYLEKFMCKNEIELSDYLYYHKGIFLKVI